MPSALSDKATVGTSAPFGRQSLAGRRPSFGRTPSFSRNVLLGALAAYAVLVSVLAMRQAGYLNADFVAYATIAHRLFDRSPSSITAYWSPLYSWCLVPLLAAGFNDLIAGRVVLALAGILYLLAIFGVASRLRTGADRRGVPLLVGVMTCAVIQAAVWANYVLTPDLLADGLLFVYLLTQLDPALPDRPRTALFGGLIAGLAYLAKAYMLPFALVQLPIAIALRQLLPAERAKPLGARMRTGLKVGSLYLAGLFLVAGPWIGVLTVNCGRLTFSSAGSSNHANVSPEAGDTDPLWNPGLVADYICDPKLSPDWSPWQDSAHLSHQLKLIAHNGANCAGTVSLWVLLTGLSVVYFAVRPRGGESSTAGNSRFGTAWCLLTVAVYCGGYCLVNLEARYIAPVAAPLLCLAAMRLFALAQNGAREPSRIADRFSALSAPAASLLFVALFLPQDLNRLIRIAWKHPQCSAVSCFQPIAESLQAAGLSKRPMASNHWHAALAVAYLSENVAEYLGAPLSQSPADVERELEQSGATVYLRWARRSKIPVPVKHLDPFVPPAPWRDALSIGKVAIQPDEIYDVTVYAR